MTIKEIHKAYKDGKKTAREVVEGYLSVIKEKDPELNAFLDLYEGDALSEADRVDEKIKNKEELGPLEGIPIAIKDNILIEGKKTTAASKILSNYKASYDAFVIEKLRAAGAIVLGKTNMDEFAMGSSTESSSFGPTRNPHNPEYVPGGSSGGSAVAVASGMAPIALGSDTGGSIRQPASFCGVVGFKPSYGQVSRSGLISMASSFDQIGPFGTCVDDVETLYSVIRGKDPKDMTSQDINEKPSNKKEFTLGVISDLPEEGLDPAVKKIFDETVAKAKKEGFKIKEISLPNLKYALAVYYVIMPAEVSSNLARLDGMRYGVQKDGASLTDVYSKSRREGFGDETRRRIILGTYVLSHGYYDAYYKKAQQVWKIIAEDFARAFESVDAVLLPTAPTPPFKLGDKTSDPLSMYLEDAYTVPANIAGIPGISLNAGSIDGMPIGVQLLGKRFEDYELLAAAKKLEKSLS